MKHSPFTTALVLCDDKFEGKKWKNDLSPASFKYLSWFPYLCKKKDVCCDVENVSCHIICIYYFVMRKYHLKSFNYFRNPWNSQVALPSLWMKESEKGMGRFILRKKQAGRSTQFEFVTVEKEGVLKETKYKPISHLSLSKCSTASNAKSTFIHV